VLLPGPAATAVISGEGARRQNMHYRWTFRLSTSLGSQMDMSRWTKPFIDVINLTVTGAKSSNTITGKTDRRMPSEIRYCGISHPMAATICVFSYDLHRNGMDFAKSGWKAKMSF